MSMSVLTDAAMSLSIIMTAGHHNSTASRYVVTAYRLPCSRSNFFSSAITWRR
jgi:hypothetical protein